MPANLPKEAKIKYQKVLEAKTKEEKLKALQEYLSSIPKHKGTENIVSQVKHQIARLRREIIEEREIKKRIRRGPSFNIKKEGDLQYVLIGFSNSGKSKLLSSLTNANVESTERPFETIKPVAGALNYEGVIIQLIDSPSLMEENKDWNDMVLSLARAADGIIIVLDAKQNIYDQFIKIKKILKENGILIGKRNFDLKIIKSSVSKPKIIMFGEIINATEKDLYKILEDYKFKNVIIEFYGKATVEEFETALLSNTVFKPAIIVINKSENLKQLKDYNFENFPCIYCSCLNKMNLKNIGEKIFLISDVIRVFTKQPHEKEFSKRPLVVKKGITVLEVAEIIHKQFAKNFKYAKIWGKNAKYPGERVGPNYVLKDGDIIEIRA